MSSNRVVRLAAPALAALMAVPVAMFGQGGSIIDQLKKAQKAIEQANRNKQNQERRKSPQPAAAGVPATSAVQGAQDANSPNFVVRINGQAISQRMPVTVILKAGLDSTKLAVGEAVPGFLAKTVNDTSDAEVSLRIVRLGLPAPSGGYADVEVSLESVDNRGTRVATPNTIARIMSNNLDRAEAAQASGGQAATGKRPARPRGTREPGVSTAREIEDIFGTGEKQAITAPPMAAVHFTIGSTIFLQPPVIPWSPKAKE